MTSEIVISIACASILLVVFLLQVRAARMETQNALNKIQRELKNATSVLHEYRKFRAAFDSSYDAMVITDAEGKILFMNESASRVTGFSRSESIGTKAGTLWGGLMPKKYYTAMWKRIKKDKLPFYGKITNHRKNGEKYTAAVSISPILNDEKNEVAFFVAVERDLGEKF